MFLWTRRMQFCHTNRKSSNKRPNIFRSMTKLLEKEFINKKSFSQGAAMFMLNAVLTAMTKIVFQNVIFFRSMSKHIRKKNYFFKNKICLPQNVPMGAKNAVLAYPPANFQEKTKNFSLNKQTC